MSLRQVISSYVVPTYLPTYLPSFTIVRGVVLYRPGRARALPMFIWALPMFAEPYQSFVTYQLIKNQNKQISKY